MKQLMPILFISIFISCSFKKNPSPSYSAQPLQTNELKRIVSSHVTGEYNVGVMLGLYDNGNEIYMPFGSNTFGQKNDAPTATTIFEIGSISKVFIGILLAKLSLDGTLNLDDPISKFLPELSITAKTKNITLKELVTHTSGLPRLPINFRPIFPSNPYSDYKDTALLGFLNDFPLPNHPLPFDWKMYSNFGAGLLGYVLSKSTGIDIEELIKIHITNPLNMSDTTMQLSDSQKLRFAPPYNSGLLATSPWTKGYGTLSGAYAMRSSAKDMMIFIKANLHPETTSISEALVLSQQIHAQTGEDKIGLGWAIEEKNKIQIIGHDGGTGGFRSELFFNKEKKRGFVMLTNTFSDVQCLKETIFFNQPCTPNFGYSVPHEKLQKYVGTYFHTQSGLTFKIARRKNYIFYEIPNQEIWRLDAVTDSKFQLWNIVTFDFLSNSDGSIGQLRFTQNNRSFELDKIE